MTRLPLVPVMGGDREGGRSESGLRGKLRRVGRRGGRGSERIEREGKPPFDSESIEVEEIEVEAGLKWFS